MDGGTQTHEDCCKIQTATLNCPFTGKPGRRVSELTLEHHVPKSLRRRLSGEVGFCPVPTCDVVYFDLQGGFIRKVETNLPVTIKDPRDEVFVCYCFNFNRSDIRRELQEKGITTIPEQIKKGVLESRCDCEKKNPQGACCLGNVANSIRAIKEELKLG